jgi:hypothetical protein
MMSPVFFQTYGGLWCRHLRLVPLFHFAPVTGAILLETDVILINMQLS